MVGQISTCLASASINIADLLNKSRGEYAYTLIDVDGPVARGSRPDPRHSRACSRRASSEEEALVLMARKEAHEPVQDPGERAPEVPAVVGAKPLDGDLAAVRTSIDAVDEQIHRC